MKNLKKMLPLIIVNIIVLFFVVLQLPKTIPTHIGLNMQIDRYGSRWTLLFMGFLPLLIYAITSKSSLSKSNNNNNIKENSKVTLLISMFTILLLIILNWFFVFISFENKVGENQVISFPIVIINVFIGLYIIIISNYFGTIKQNHFLGIRIPWTLRNEFNWRKTHRLAGYTGVVGGIIICISSILSFITNIMLYSMIGLVLGSILFVVIPIIYSFMLYKRGNVL